MSTQAPKAKSKAQTRRNIAERQSPRGVSGACEEDGAESGTSKGTALHGKTKARAELPRDDIKSLTTLTRKNDSMVHCFGDEGARSSAEQAMRERNTRRDGRYLMRSFEKKDGSQRETSSIWSKCKRRNVSVKPSTRVD
jgi:hypothetical protein